MSQATASLKRFDVVIVGFGPTGATLANLLGMCGVSTLVLDRQAAPYPLPRAVHFDDEVMRVFQSIGVADDVAKITRVNRGMRFVDAAGKLLLDWPRPQEIGPNGWYASYRFHQPELEKILHTALKHRETIEIQPYAEVEHVADHCDMAEVQYKDLRNGQSHTVTAKYVVGCDGARSTIREFIGTTFEDLGFHQRWLVIDVLLKRPKPELGDFTIQYCNPSRPATYARGPGDRRRWEISVRDDEDSDEISTPESVWNLLKPWLSPDEADLERMAVYTFKSTIAKEWRQGRLLIAGDAAHLTPPFMGQGMCAGIRDVANLAWKLALCVKNLADDTLLESYQEERHPHVKEYIETAVRLGELINVSGTQEALHSVFQQSDGTARMQSIAPRLGRGLSAGSDTHRGRYSPQPKLARDGMMDDHCGYAPVLLIDKDLFTETGATHPALFEGGLCLLTSDVEPEIHKCLEKYNARAVLLRPDRYILGTANDEDELKNLIKGAYASPINNHAKNKI